MKKEITEIFIFELDGEDLLELETRATLINIQSEAILTAIRLIREKNKNKSKKVPNKEMEKLFKAIKKSKK